MRLLSQLRPKTHLCLRVSQLHSTVAEFIDPVRELKPVAEFIDPLKQKKVGLKGGNDSYPPLTPLFNPTLKLATAQNL